MRSVFGGIGDFIQTFEEAQQIGRIKVFTHFLNAPDFYAPFGIQTTCSFFDDRTAPEAFIEAKAHTPLNRTPYPKIKPPLESSNKAKDILSELGGRPIVGIHPIGSQFSNMTWLCKGMPLKFMPPAFIEQLIEPKKNYLIFGTRKELLPYQSLKGSNVRFVSEDLIWHSLAYVDYCTLIIAVDSAIKSYAAANRIPSIVLVGDYPDGFRDANFLDPYAGHMSVIRFAMTDSALISRIKKEEQIVAGSRGLFTHS